MRKLLFIFVLISITLYACAQETDYEDLPEITTPSGTDGFVIYKSGSGYKMTYSTAFAAIIDSLQIHNDSLLSYDIRILATYDSIAWLSDTVFQHNLRLLTLEAGGGILSDSSWTSISTDTVKEFTSGHGVLIDQLLIKDNGIWGNGSVKLTFASNITAYSDIDPNGASQDVGGVGAPWDNFYGNFYRVNEVATPGAPSANDGVFYMDNADEKPYFKNSTKTYDLTSGSSDIKTMYAASIGRGLTGDSAYFQTGATYQRIWYAGPDSIQIDTCRAVADDNDSSVDMDYNIIFQEQRISGSWTNVWSTPITISGADAITTGEITTTFTVDKIPPYSWIEK